MKKRSFKLLALILTMVMLVVGLPVSSLAASIDAEEVFSYNGNFVLSDWTGKNNTPTVISDGSLRLSADANQNYATVTYKDTYDLSNGFELSYSANGRTSFNNIYSGSYYVGVKIGNITVAMDQYVKPTILVDGAKKAQGSAIISYSSAADVSYWLTHTESKYNVKYTVSYDPASKTITYAKYHNTTKAFEISYTDNEGIIDLSNAAVALYHNNSWAFYATYYSIALSVEPAIADPSTLPGGDCGENAKWGFDEKTGALYIYGSGAMDNYVNVGNIAPWSAEYRTLITKVIIGDEITHIGNRAFKGHNRITTVKFGKNVQTMGYECFYLCNKLEKIELNEGLTNIGALTFYNCTALTQITIPSTVTNLENRAFKGSGLTSVVVPDTVTKTGYEVFMNCASLKEVDFTEGVSMLQPCTFMNCTSLTKFEFTDNMCRIRANAFNGCTALKSVYFEDDSMMWGSSNGQEAKIASNAFEGCNEILKLIGTNDSHVETYATNKGFTFVDRMIYDEDGDSDVLIPFSKGLNVTGMETFLSDNPWGFFEDGVKVVSDPYTYSNIKSQGFDYVRIAVNFYSAYYEAPTGKYNYTTEQIMQVVDKGIEYAFANDLYVMLDFHGWFLIGSEADDYDQFLYCWSQVAERYKDYSDKLSFELLNEPWYTDAKPQKYLWDSKLNEMQADAIEIIRNTGSKNKTRLIVCCTADGNKAWKLEKLELPDDPYLAVAIHEYEPYKFTGQNFSWDKYAGQTFTLAEAGGWGAVDYDFSMIKDFMDKTGIPVILNEFGSNITSPSQADVVAYLSGITQRCQDLGIGWAWWHYHRTSYSESGDMALYRKNSEYGSMTWDQVAVDALMLKK